MIVTLIFFIFKEIDEFHPSAPFKYLRNKPVRDLSGEQFLKMCHAEQEKLVKIKITVDNDLATGLVIQFIVVYALPFRSSLLLYMI